MNEKFSLKGSQITDPVELNQEMTRGWLAKLFVIFFMGIVIVFLIFLIFSKEVSIEKSNLIATTILSPLVGIFGVVIGFYFGKK